MGIVEWLRLWAPSVSPKLDEAADEIEKLRKENQTQALDFLASEGEWWELIGKKDKEIEQLREALNKISSEYREIANPDSFQKEIREVLQNPNVFTMIASIIHRYEKCVRIARAALKEDE